MGAYLAPGFEENGILSAVAFVQVTKPEAIERAVEALLDAMRRKTTDDEAAQLVAKARCENVAASCSRYALRHGKYPRDLQTLLEPDDKNFGHPWLDGEDSLTDPWGNELQIKVTGRKIEILSYGADHRRGGEHFDADISNTSPAIEARIEEAVEWKTDGKRRLACLPMWPGDPNLYLAQEDGLLVIARSEEILEKALAQRRGTSQRHSRTR